MASKLESWFPVVAFSSLSLLSSVTAHAESPRGIAITPRHFPHHTLADVDDAFNLAHELGQHAVFMYQWGQLDLGIARAMVERARNAGLTPLLALSPTTLDRGRKELDLPARVRKKAGRKVSFTNRVVRSAYVDTARQLAQLKPPYLCLATEINLLAMQNLPEYLAFVPAYQDAYRAVKQVSPDTQVFVTFQWEWMRALDEKEPARIAEHRQVIDILRPQLDLAGFTTYPAFFFETPDALPADYFTRLFQHIPMSEPVMLMEVGWPTSGNGSEAEQSAFVARLPKLLKGMNLVGVEWALLHDVKLDAFGAELNSVGLRAVDGKAKPAYGGFRSLKLP